MPRLLSTFLLFLVVAAAAAVGPEDFRDIETPVPQDVTAIHLGVPCPTTGRHTKAMFTIEPSNDNDTATGVTVSTYPPNLVTAKKQRYTLELTWNPKVAYGANEGGVIITLPKDQLQSVSVSSDHQAQVLDGFTNIQTLDVSSDASLFATLNSLTNVTGNERLDNIRVSSDGKAEIISNIPVQEVRVSSDAKLQLKTPFVEQLDISSDGQVTMRGSSQNQARVSSNGKLTLDGDLDGEGSFSSDAQATVYGSVVTGTVDLSSDASLRVGTEIRDGATIHASSDAHVRAPSCDHVTTQSDAQCIVDTDSSISGQVDFTIPVKPLTRTGTERCWKSTGFVWWGWLILGLVVFGSVYAVCACCHKRRARKYRDQEHQAPASSSSSSAAYPAPAAPKNGELPPAQVVAVEYVGPPQQNANGKRTTTTTIITKSTQVGDETV